MNKEVTYKFTNFQKCGSIDKLIILRSKQRRRQNEREFKYGKYS